jgi:hypothetical protein
MKNNNLSFNFENAALRNPGTSFEVNQNREIVARLNFPDLRATVLLDQLVGCLEISRNSRDFALASIIPSALKYVSEIKQGDPVPFEIIDGRPSWIPEPSDLRSGVASAWAILDRHIDPSIHFKLGETLEKAAILGGTEFDEVIEETIKHIGSNIPAIKPEVATENLRSLLVDSGRVSAMRTKFTSMRAVIRTIKEFAAARQKWDRIGSLASSLARMLGNFSNWANLQLIDANMIIEEPLRQIISPRSGQSKIWSSLASLRSFFGDFGQIMKNWSEAVFRYPNRIDRAVEHLHATSYHRYLNVDPEEFRWSPLRGAQADAMQKLTGLFYQEAKMTTA